MADDSTGNVGFPTGEGVCFVIGPVGEPDSDVRKDADQLLEYIITPAAEAAGLKHIIRADQISSSNIITSEILEHLVEDAIVVADLTGGNPNVFYELAVRHLLRKPFVHLVPKGFDLPFDTAGVRAIHFELSLDGAREAVPQLTETIRNELNKAPEAVQTPFTVALDRLALEVPSGSALNREIARISEKLDELLKKDGDNRWNVEYRPLSTADGPISVDDLFVRDIGRTGPLGTTESSFAVELPDTGG